MRLNWFAIVVATIVFFLLGWLWYDLLFGKLWMAEIAKLQAPTPGAMSGGAWYALVVSIVTAFFLAYGLAWVLSWRNDVTASRGAFIGLSLGILIFGTMTWMDYAYSGFGVTLGWINVGYVVVGMALQGLILGAWKAKSAT